MFNFEIQDSRFKIQCSRFKIQCSRFNVQDFKIQLINSYKIIEKQTILFSERRTLFPKRWLVFWNLITA